MYHFAAEINFFEDGKFACLVRSSIDIPKFFFKSLYFASKIEGKIYENVPFNTEGLKSINTEFPQYLVIVGMLDIKKLQQTYKFHLTDEIFGTGKTIKDFIPIYDDLELSDKAEYEIKLIVTEERPNLDFSNRHQWEELEGKIFALIPFKDMDIYELTQQINQTDMIGLNLNFVEFSSIKAPAYVPVDDLAKKLEEDYEFRFLLFVNPTSDISLYGMPNFRDLHELLMQYPDYLWKLLERLSSLYDEDSHIAHIYRILVADQIQRLTDTNTGEIIYDEENDKNIEKIKDRINRLLLLSESSNLKSFLYRMLSGLENDLSKALELANLALEVNPTDKEDRIYAFQNMLQVILQTDDIDLIKDYCDKLKEELPVEYHDVIYETYGHIGMKFLNNFGDKDSARENFEILYSWLKHRIFMYDISDEFINVNYVLFMSLLAEIYISQKLYNQAEDVLSLVSKFLFRFRGLLIIEREEFLDVALEEYIKQRANLTILTAKDKRTLKKNIKKIIKEYIDNLFEKY